MQVSVYLLFRFNERLAAPVSFTFESLVSITVRLRWGQMSIYFLFSFFSINFEYKKDPRIIFYDFGQSQVQ